MGVSAPSLRVVRHESPDGRMEMVFGEPDPRLRPHVAHYCGYDEVTSTLARRIEPAGLRVPLIVNLGPPLAVRAPGDARWHDHGQGFVAGLHDAYAVTDSGGAQAGVEVNLMPAGARLVLGSPMREVRGRVVDLEAAFGAAGPRLRERLLETVGWPERFAILDAFLVARIAARLPPPASLARALARLGSSRGTADIGTVSAELGHSPRYLIALFNEHIGVPPKLYARILRFEHAVEVAATKTGGGWAQIAQRCGYYDQAHMIRDFREFTGHAPGSYERLRQPDGLGVTAD